jgi:hypothetical protein
MRSPKQETYWLPRIEQTRLSCQPYRVSQLITK